MWPADNELKAESKRVPNVIIFLLSKISIMTHTTVPLISIIIPTFNRAALLPRAIDSALRQTHASCEVIIVDDGSTDNTAQIVAHYGHKIRYIRQSNAGASEARNRGIHEASGTLIAFLDSDDTWHSEKLARQAALFTTPEIGAVHCAIRVEYTDRGGTKGIYYPGDCLSLHDVLALRIPWPTAMMVRRDVLMEIGGFDETLVASEDWELCIRIAQKYILVGIPEVLAHYQEGTPGHLSGVRSRYRMECRIQRKYRNLLARQCPDCRRSLNVARKIQRDWHFAQLCDLSRQAFYAGRFSGFLRYRFTAVAFDPLRAIHEAPGVLAKNLLRRKPAPCPGSPHIKR